MRHEEGRGESGRERETERAREYNLEKSTTGHVGQVGPGYVSSLREWHSYANEITLFVHTNMIGVEHVVCEDGVVEE
eukprot:263482-Hanusia_phi.AAC.3